jgi:hypothetical protein
VLSVHLATPADGTPSPRPTDVPGAPALLNVTLTVPACVALNNRDTAPLVVRVVDKVLVVGDVGVVGDGVVGVSSPHDEVKSAAPITVMTPANRRNLMSAQG